MLGYRYRSHLFEGAQRWVTFVMTLIGATVVTITGTLGGSLNGTPSLVTKTIGKLGWEVYMTFYLPTWMLWAFGLGAVAIVALGMTVVIISGGIDLSVGSVLCLSAMGLAITMNAGYSLAFAAPLAIAAALLVGFINGALIAYLRIPPFVVTLGMLSIARSAARIGPMPSRSAAPAFA